MRLTAVDERSLCTRLSSKHLWIGTTHEWSWLVGSPPSIVDLGDQDLAQAAILERPSKMVLTSTDGATQRVLNSSTSRTLAFPQTEPTPQ